MGCSKQAFMALYSFSQPSTLLFLRPVEACYKSLITETKFNHKLMNLRMLKDVNKLYVWFDGWSPELRVFPETACAAVV